MCLCIYCGNYTYSLQNVTHFAQAIYPVSNTSDLETFWWEHISKDGKAKYALSYAAAAWKDVTLNFLVDLMTSVILTLLINEKW